MLFLHQNATRWKVQFLCEALEGGPMAPPLSRPFNSFAYSRPPLRPECTLESPEQAGNLLQTFFSCDLSYPSLNGIFYRKETLNFSVVYIGLGFPGGPSGKERTFEWGRHKTWVQSLDQEDPLEEGMATHSSILACIPWTEEPGRLQSIRSKSIRHD